MDAKSHAGSDWNHCQWCGSANFIITHVFVCSRDGRIVTGLGGMKRNDLFRRMSFHSRLNRKVAFAMTIAVIVFFAAVWMAGGSLASPHRQPVGNIPADLNAQEIRFPSQSGSTISGWSAPKQNGKGTVILLHGIRSTRLSMVERARFLSHAGYGTLLIDLQAHGESTGQQITFGYLESRDTAAAVDFLRRPNPTENIAIIGVSLGGAAALLATPPLEVNALVLESVYPTIEEATANRLAMRLGSWAKALTPLLTLQLKPRLGIGRENLCPIEHVKESRTPKLIIYGTTDRHTTVEESQRLVEAAMEPKESWAVQGAGHIDLHAYSRVEYEERVLLFLSKHLK